MIKFDMADYLAYKQNRGQRILSRKHGDKTVYHVGFGRWSEDRDAAIRYDSQSVPRIVNTKTELA